MLLLIGTTTWQQAYACPPPVQIDIECGDDCDITIVTGDDNEVNDEGKKGPVGEIVDDVLDFFGKIFKKKKKKKEDDDSSSKKMTENSEQTPGYTNRLSQLARQFDDLNITNKGLVLLYKPKNAEESCEASFSFNSTIDIPLKPKMLYYFGINEPKSLKAGRYATNKQGAIFIPFK